MMTMIELQVKTIKYYFDKIAYAVGKAKEPEIRRCCLGSDTASAALQFLLSPAVVFHLGEKSFQKDVSRYVGCPYANLFSMLDDLRWKPALTDQDIANVKDTLATISDESLRDYAKEYLCKSITLGVTAATVNKAMGIDIIPEFRCMLANKYFDHPEAVEGNAFFLTEKLDGIRCIAIADWDGVGLFTRQGKPIQGLVEIENELLSLHEQCGLDFVLDGELLIENREGIPSKEQYKRTTKIVRTDGDKHGIVLHAFDILDAEAFENCNCTVPYYMRRQKLETIVRAMPRIKALPVLYSGTDTSVIPKFLDAQRKRDHEGIMINLATETYQFKRTNALLKVKVMQDCDLEIIGVEEGNGKFQGTLGALIVDYKGNPVGVGSGLSDAMRREVWQAPEKYIGRIATIQYFEETNDADGKKSIRFPVFKELREEGKDVSYS